MMDSNDRVKKAGSLLAEAWMSSTQIEQLSDDLFPRSIEEATQIQDVMADAIEDKVAGWKVAGRPGPLLGRVFEAHVYQAPVDLPVNRYHNLLMECEVGFRMTADLPARAAPYGEDEVLDSAIATCNLELVDTRFINGKHIPENDRHVLQICADNAAHAALVVGPDIPDWRAVDLTSIDVVARIDGGEALAKNSGGIERPEVTLVWLANTLSDRGIGLSEGQYITTGSLTHPSALRRGNQVTAAFGDFGAISLIYAAD
jgi:2-keto-4-pentenoate hydratase